MGKARTGDYISKSYEDRIEIGLANISRGPNDKFQLLGSRYYPATFKCELDGHEPCITAFMVKNLSTNITIKVGSECINHFGFNKHNIDLAMGLLKRIKSVTRKMRRNMKKSVDETEYQAMPKEQKRAVIVRLFMKFQAIEAMKAEGDTKKALLRKEDVLAVIAETPFTVLEGSDTEDEVEVRKEKKVAKKVAKKAAPAKAAAPATP